MTTFIYPNSIIRIKIPESMKYQSTQIIKGIAITKEKEQLKIKD